MPLTAPDGERIWRKTGRVGPLLRFLTAHPGAARDLPRWVLDWTGSTLDRRQPWWPYPVIRAVGEHVRPGSLVFEYGGGGSTLWLQDWGCIVTAVEHDRDWFELLATRVSEATSVHFVPPAEHGDCASHVMPGRFFDDYVAAIERMPPDSLDLLVIDGRARVACVRAAATRVKRGGLLLFDDSNRAEYAGVHELLSEWPSRTFAGFKPGGLFESTTTLWTRPTA